MHARNFQTNYCIAMYSTVYARGVVVRSKPLPDEKMRQKETLLVSACCGNWGGGSKQGGKCGRGRRRLRQPSRCYPPSSKASRKRGTPMVCSAPVSRSLLFLRSGKRPCRNSFLQPSLGCWTNMRAGDESRRRLRFPRGTWPQRSASEGNVVGVTIIGIWQ